MPVKGGDSELFVMNINIGIKCRNTTEVKFIAISLYVSLTYIHVLHTYLPQTYRIRTLCFKVCDAFV